MFLRRPLPYSTFNIQETGEEEKVWTTFGKTDPSEQIDLDTQSKQVRQLLTDIFKNFKDNNVKMVRLGAVGYIIKKLGTSCFFIEPDIYDSYFGGRLIQLKDFGLIFLFLLLFEMEQFLWGILGLDFSSISHFWRT